MSARKNPRAPSGGKRNSEEQRENLLQAVVLADSFQNRFKPLTIEKPRCLLPLANTPLIDYTLEFLSLAGVEDVYIFASAHADKIDEYIRSSKWNMPSSPFRTCQIMVSTSSMSVGDAMRELDDKHLIETDFLLVNGDFVSNLPLEEVLAEHRKRRTADKNAIMTMILREAGSAHRTKARGETGVFVIDNESKRCVHYSELRSSEETKILLPPELTKEHSELQIRNDLIDCSVDICSPDVPALFAENFDYQTIRRDFLRGILEGHDLYGKTIHAHIITGHYAARVRSLQTYDAVSRDVMSRWTFPLCPDSNLGGQSYRLERRDVYREDGVALARTAIVKPMTVLGARTNIDEHSIVGESVIGKDCSIGKNTLIERSYIWDAVVIGDGCKIESAVIASNAVLGNNCIIEPGAIISYGVTLKDGTVVSGTSRLTQYKRKRDSDDDDELHSEASYIMNEGAGFEYEDSESEDEDETALATQDGLIFKMTHLNVSESSVSTISGDEESDDEFHHRKTRKPRADSTATATSDENDDADAWHKEASISLLTALENDHPPEVASLELNSLRMSANASWHQVRRASVSAIVARIDALVNKHSKTVPQAADGILEKWQPLIKRMIFERPDQVDFLLLTQKELVDKKIGESLLLKVVMKLYDLEVVKEEGVNAWWVDKRSSTEVGGMSKIRKSTEAFVKWLAEAEEEGSSSSEEDTEEEEADDDDE
ncbi:translation initiation factor eIF-2B epsilon subunit, GEF [Rhizina undulata]